MSSKFYKAGFFILLIIFVSVALMAPSQRWPWIEGKGFAFQHGQTISSSHSDSLVVTVGSESSGFHVPRVVAERVVFTEDAGRTGEGTCLFANGIPIGMATPGDCQGMKMEFDYGVTKTSFAAGRMAIGLLVKMTMDEVYLPDATPYNAVVRGASIQAVSEDTVGGRVVGAYINAIAEAGNATAEVQGYWSGATSAGVVGMHLRTEIGATDTIVTPAVAGLFIYHRSKVSSAVDGDYRAIQINQPQIDAPGTMDGTEYGIYFCDDLGTADVFDYAFGFDTNLDGSGASQICYAEVDMDGDMDSADKVDGWIKVDVDGTAMYIYLSSTRPQ